MRVKYFLLLIKVIYFLLNFQFFIQPGLKVLNRNKAGQKSLREGFTVDIGYCFYNLEEIFSHVSMGRNFTHEWVKLKNFEIAPHSGDNHSVRKWNLWGFHELFEVTKISLNLSPFSYGNLQLFLTEIYILSMVF